MSLERPLLSDTDSDSLSDDGEFSIEEHRTIRPTNCRWYKGTFIMVCTTFVVGLVTFFVVQALLGGAASQKDYSQEKKSAYWRKAADDELKKTLKSKPILGQAKNVIMFIGDGMGPTTVTAGRILGGQMKGLKGEDHKLSFDKFPHTGMAVTYSVDTQVTDSAASATAYTSGVKTNQGILGLNAQAIRGNCSSAKGNEVESILKWFLKDGRAAGVVTTTTVTHATPGSTYVHTPDRGWEVDTLMPEEARNAGCKDIARQLIEENPDINVIMGGGMNSFKPSGYVHPHPDPNQQSNVTKGRLDDRDLTQEWQDEKAKRKLKYKFVSDRDEFDKVNPKETDYLLGLFAEFHMYYELERNPAWEPSLAEMTEKAIKVLQNNDKGFFLMVEGGRIDHGHHKSQPSLALHDVVAFSDAVEKAVQLTSEKDTLILVTADHSHTFTIAGYAHRGNPILEKSVPTNGDGYAYDKMPYTTLLYADGPGYRTPRENISLVNTTDKYYTSQSGVFMDSETHGGEDVAMYAYGPQAYLYSGVHENNYIPILMAYAACVGPYSNEKDCAEPLEKPNASPSLQMPHVTILALALILIEMIRDAI